MNETLEPTSLVSSVISIWRLALWRRSCMWLKMKSLKVTGACPESVCVWTYPCLAGERWTTSSRAVRAETRAMSAGLAVCLAKPREGDRNLLQQLIPQDGV
jgi:hypothetical protein